MTEPDLADAHAAGTAALVNQLGMAEHTARNVAAVTLAAALPALPSTVRSVLTLTSEAAGMHIGVAIQRAVAASVDAALTEERAITGPRIEALTWEREQLAARVAELEAPPTAEVRAGMVVGVGGEPTDVYRFMRDFGHGHERAVQETIYQAFLTVGPTESVREGWHLASCSLCDWQTTGTEDVVEDAAYEHAAGHVDQLERAGWVVASAHIDPGAQVHEATPSPVLAVARVGDVIGQDAHGISDNVLEFRDRDGDRHRRNEGDDRFTADDPNHEVPLDWHCLGGMKCTTAAVLADGLPLTVTKVRALEPQALKPAAPAEEAATDVDE